MTRMRTICCYVFLVVALSSVDAFADEGSCQNFDFPRDAEGQVDWPYPVKVIEQDAIVEAGPDSRAGSQVLDFNSTLQVIDVQGSRAQVQQPNTYTPLGWVERSALLCAIAPLKGASGNIKRVYVKPDNAASSPHLGATAYPVSDLFDCAGQCQTLAPFSGYFVFAERNGSYLLGDAYRLDGSSKLIGWLSQNEALLWEGAVGVRPADDTTICVYPSPDEAVQESHESCVSLPGNAAWYRSDRRLLLLDQQQHEGLMLWHVLCLLPQEFLTSDVMMAEGYIPASEPVEQDVWMLSDDVDRWLSLLREFQAFEDVYTHEYEDLREQFVFALTDALEKVLRRSLRESINIPLREYVQQEGGLPVRDDSPLFRYSIAELMSPESVPECEITRLITWLHQSEELLRIVYHGDQRPQFQQEPFPGECPSGEAIPYIPGDIRALPFGDDAMMRYDHNFQKAHAYWVPKLYLP